MQPGPHLDAPTANGGEEALLFPLPHVMVFEAWVELVQKQGHHLSIGS